MNGGEKSIARIWEAREGADDAAKAEDDELISMMGNDLDALQEAKSKQITLVKAVKNLGYADSVTVARRGRMLYLVKKEG